MQGDGTPMDAPGTSVPDDLEPRLLDPVWRAVLIVVGTAALVLGIVGVFLPVLPTTPFLLVAAACYARASSRLYRWLLGQRLLGPIITEWRRSRSLPPRVKTRALVVLTVTFAVSILLVEAVVLKIGLAGTGIVLAAFLYRIPTAAPSLD